MAFRQFAYIAPVEQDLRVKHYSGFPPEVSGGEDHGAQMGRPRVLVLEERPDGIFLFRLGAKGADCGDTWHMNVEDARAQAVYEYQNALGEWQSIPDSADDARGYALARLNENASEA
jgi:hypothetical protein